MENMRPEFFLAGMKAQRDKGGGRILLGDNTGGGAVILRTVRFQFGAVWIPAGLPCIYTYSWSHICHLFSSHFRKIRLELDLAQRNDCVSGGGPVQGCNPSPSNVRLHVAIHVCNIVLRLLCYLQKDFHKNVAI